MCPDMAITITEIVEGTADLEKMEEKNE